MTHKEMLDILRDVHRRLGLVGAATVEGRAEIWLTLYAVTTALQDEKPCKTVREIVAAYLRDHGFDGLCAEGCGCGVDELYICEGGDCVPGYRIDDPEDGFIIVEDVEAWTKEQEEG